MLEAVLVAIHRHLERKAAVLVLWDLSYPEKVATEPLGRDHLLHQLLHLLQGFFLILAFKLFFTALSLELLLVEFIFDKGACHNSVDFFKVFEDGVSWLLFLPWKELADVVVRVESW